ncbi:MAG TPA: 2-C-methyl-D-erythritol 4-phosphate cytidylyltransferase [Candidatus Limnocylindrales bacterium]|nr:2-C-methyl-D-erythritol 4-phosphate cytidylyltransferase [Candidatus Limnocylindrales bacterium]
MGGPDSADAIIVAAGASSRMNGTDKLLAPIDGKPLLAHTIEAIERSDSVGSVVVVTTDARRGALVGGGWVDGSRTTFVDGGERRQDSVRAGFAALERLAPDRAGDRVVLVHDGARPIVDPSLVADVIAATERVGAAVPVVPVSDTIKRVTGDRIEATVDRSDLVAAQTPQGVRRGLLREALASPLAADGTWTDEAALLEACNIAVHVVRGDPANLKVTVPDDLDRVANLLAGGRAARRTGIGRDSHPFGPGSPLRLGGIEIPGAPALHGHSDGDVALHALADALLGAAGSGDLGRLFPAGPSTPRGADSRELLAAVVARLAGDGWRPASVDLTIVAARPRLGPHLDAMRAAIAATLGASIEAVNVKASTGNLDGAEGAGRAISALAVATIEGRA